MTKEKFRPLSFLGKFGKGERASGPRLLARLLRDEQGPRPIKSSNDGGLWREATVLGLTAGYQTPCKGGGAFSGVRPHPTSPSRSGRVLGLPLRLAYRAACDVCGCVEKRPRNVSHD
jgi:hypothetical protein